MNIKDRIIKSVICLLAIPFLLVCLFLLGVGVLFLPVVAFINPDYVKIKYKE